MMATFNLTILRGSNEPAIEWTNSLWERLECGLWSEIVQQAAMAASSVIDKLPTPLSFPDFSTEHGQWFAERFDASIDGSRISLLSSLSVPEELTKRGGEGSNGGSPIYLVACPLSGKAGFSEKPNANFCLMFVYVLWKSSKNLFSVIETGGWLNMMRRITATLPNYFWYTSCKDVDISASQVDLFSTHYCENLNFLFDDLRSWSCCCNLSTTLLSQTRTQTVLTFRPVTRFPPNWKGTIFAQLSSSRPFHPAPPFAHIAFVLCSQ